jgi:hypothetical protein
MIFKKPVHLMRAFSALIRTGFFLLFFSTSARGGDVEAGPDTGLNVPITDDNFVRSFRNQPHFTFEFARRRQIISVRNANIDTLVLRFEPNTRTNFLASFDYKWLSLSIGLISFDTRGGSRKGESNQFSLRASFNGKRIWNTNFIQYYSGFYLANPQVVDPAFNSAVDVFPSRSDVSTSTIFSNVYYCFRPERFSYRAALWQIDRQEKSAGSFLAGASLRFYGMLADSGVTLIPTEVQPFYNPSQLVVAQRVSNFNFNVGYVHTFVYNKSWFATIYFVPGISIQNSFFQAQDQQIVRDPGQILGMSEFRIIMGYNGEKWFGGISSYSISFSGNSAQSLWIDNSYSWFRLFAGFRIKAPGPDRKAGFLERIGL